MVGTNGIGTKVQIGKETVWGTKVVPTVNLNFTGESFKQEVETLEEDTVIAAISAKAQDVVALNASGGFDTVLKPEDALALFALAFGVQAVPTKVGATTSVYDHIITPVDALTELPSFTAIVDRKLHVKAYTGNQINSFELSAKAKDYLRVKIGTVCKGEETGVIVGGLAAPTKKAYIFANGQFLIDTVPFADISAVTFTAANNVAEGDQTLGSGLYKSQGTHGLREYKVSAEAKFTAQANTLITDKYTTATPVAVKLVFESPEVIETTYKHKIQIEFPVAIITSPMPNISGKDEIKVTIEAKALEGVDVPCRVTVTNATATTF